MDTIRLVRFAFVATSILFSLAERFNTRMFSDRAKCVGEKVHFFTTRWRRQTHARARRRHGFVDAEIGKKGKEGKEG